MSSRSSASSKQRTGRGFAGTSTPNVEPLFGPGYPIQTRGRHSFSCRSVTSCLLIGVSAILGLLTAFNTAFSLCYIHQTYQLVTPPAWAPDFSHLNSVNYICDIIHPTSTMPDGIDTRLKALEDRLGYQQLAIEGENIDVAIFAAGARIIPQLTSPSYPNKPVPVETLPIPSWYHNLPPLSWVFRTAPERPTTPRGAAPPRETVTRPRVVLEDLLINGDCWQFEGHAGQVAIQFPHPVNITGMAIHYVHPRILVPAARKQAPRLIAMWALQDGRNINDTDPEINTKSDTIQEGDTHPKRMRSAISFLNPGTSHSLPGMLEDSDIFSPIITAEYLLNDLRPVQMFPRTQPGESLIQTVVVEVLSNWGADNTCLYHIGIHANFDPIDTGAY